MYTTNVIVIIRVGVMVVMVYDATGGHHRLGHIANTRCLPSVQVAHVIPLLMPYMYPYNKSLI